MSALNITGDLAVDRPAIIGLMLFPCDQKMRNAHVVRLQARNAANGGAPVLFEPGALASLLDAPGMEQVRSAAAIGARKGVVAGDLLAMIYVDHVNQITEPSFGRALRNYGGWAASRTYGDGEPLKYAEQTLRDFWAASLSVAHLWAAYRLLCFAPFGDRAFDIFSTSSSINRFLGVAKTIAAFAESFVPKRTRPEKPIIAPRVLIEIPAEIPLVRLALIK